jgi:hypothetical protein
MAQKGHVEKGPVKIAQKPGWPEKVQRHAASQAVALKPRKSPPMQARETRGSFEMEMAGMRKERRL